MLLIGKPAFIATFPLSPSVFNLYFYLPIIFSQFTIIKPLCIRFKSKNHRGNFSTMSADSQIDGVMINKNEGCATRIGRVFL